MAELQRNFLQGIMNKDLDPHFLPDGQYRDALNIIVADSDGTFSTVDGEHNGVAQNYLGNIQMNESIGLGNSAICIGAISNPAANTIYWFVTSDSYDAIYEYNEQQNTTTAVLKSSKDAGNVLNFNALYRITGVNYINGLLFWTDNYNPPRKINIERSKNYPINQYGESVFTEDDISVILRPPIASPALSFPVVDDTLPNNLENKFLYFAYRYKYLDDEYSSLSPFSPVAFFPKPFAYDYGVSENISMVNSKSAVDLEYYTGGHNVKEIQLVFMDTQSTNTYVIDNINKQANNFADNVKKKFRFQNNKVYTILPQDQVNRLFDNVPLKAQSQDLIGSRLIYGNYTQFFNLVDFNGIDIKPKFSITFTGTKITDNLPHATFKSNRDYEVGIVYLDEYGRSTTVIVPTENTNTVYIPADRANYANDIMVTIDKNYTPPAFATYYRFVLKQNKQEYYNVFPLTYYSDGQFKWFLINQADVDKVTVGSYLYLKNSTNGNLNTQFKILDVVSKSANFLNNSKSQPAGVYFKVKIEDVILPKTYNYKFTNIGYSAPNTPTPPMIDSFSVAEKAIFYGIGDGTKMTTSNSNIYTGVNDIRFKIEISATNKFKYYAFLLGTSYTYVNELTITAGINQTLSYTYGGNTYSCTILFSDATGYTLRDYWIINCRSNGGKNIFGGPAITTGLLSRIPPFGWATGTNWNVNNAWDSDRPIEAGATLSFKTKEPNNGNNDVSNTFVSTKRYVNIEEWFIEDGAYNLWVQYEGALSVGAKNICFRRVGSFQKTSADYYDANLGGSISDTTLSYPVFMLIYGYIPPNTANIVLDMEVTFDFQESLAPVLFETVPTDTNQDIYYELTNTYPIVNGNHYTNSINQSLGLTDGVAYLKKQDSTSYPNYDFNAFAWSNGVESFRIRDDWNAAKMEFSPRANSTIEGYAQQTLVQALTYSGVYQQTTAINRLNEFNLSLGNFKYLDRFFGSIEKLHARDTDLIVFQENKVSKVLYGKNLISDSVGGGTIASIPEVLGTQIAYVGEYGISKNPESFATWGNNMYFTDARRGAVLQLSEAGLFEISSNGMKNWFKGGDIDPITGSYQPHLDVNTLKIGMMDPYFEHYVVYLDNTSNSPECEISVSSTSVGIGGDENNNQPIFNIISNSQWFVSLPDNDWITITPTQGNGNAQISATTTAYVGNRSIVATVSGCNTTINVTINQASNFWYKLRNCSTNEIKFSISYDSNLFSVNNRVVSGISTYVVTDTLIVDPGGSQIQISSTGENGCPVIPPTEEWYYLIDCSTGETDTTALYPIGTFSNNQRVTSGLNTFRVSGSTTTDPGGLQIYVDGTNLTGCPAPVPTREWYSLINCQTGTTSYSISYPIGTYEYLDRVTAAGNTYTVYQTLTTQPSGTLLTLTSTGLTGCPETSTVVYYSLIGTGEPASLRWYKLTECQTGTIKYSVGYPSTTIYPLNQRVITNDTGNPCVVSEIFTVNPGGSQVSFYATPYTGCPSLPTNEWYKISDCSTGDIYYSSDYPQGTCDVNYQVSTELGFTGVVLEVLHTMPTSPMIAVGFNGNYGCPPQVWYRLQNCTTSAFANSVAFNSGFYNVGDRVSSTGSFYVVTDILTNNQGGTLINITPTGFTGCPGPSPTQEWYSLVNCTTSETKNSSSYSIGTYHVNDRVTSGANTYRIASILSTDPGGTQILIDPTGLTGCPSAPTIQEWYSLVNCVTGASYNSIAYAQDTYNVNDRVTSGSNTYKVTAVLNANPGGSLLTLTSTGLTGCPYEWYQLYICDTGQTKYSLPYTVGSFVVNERVLTDADVYGIVTNILTSEPLSNKIGIGYTGFFNCP